MIDHIILGTHKATGRPGSPRTEFPEHEICSGKTKTVPGQTRMADYSRYVSIQTETKKTDCMGWEQR